MPRAPSTRTKKAPRRKQAGRNAPAPRKWSAAVMQRSNALDLEHGVFAGNDPKRIAQSLKRSAERSTRRKAGPYQSAMSMLNFYINRGGRNLPAAQKRILARAKDELRRLYGRT